SASRELGRLSGTGPILRKRESESPPSREAELPGLSRKVGRSAPASFRRNALSERSRAVLPMSRYPVPTEMGAPPAIGKSRMYGELSAFLPLSLLSDLPLPPLSDFDPPSLLGPGGGGGGGGGSTRLWVPPPRDGSEDGPAPRLGPGSLLRSGR